MEQKNLGFEVVDRGHSYKLANMTDQTHQSLHFIKKEESKEIPGQLVTVLQGTTNEAVLGVLIDRLNFLYEKLPSEETLAAITHLNDALSLLNSRTKDRTDRGVEGTNKE